MPRRDKGAFFACFGLWCMVFARIIVETHSASFLVWTSCIIHKRQNMCEINGHTTGSPWNLFLLFRLFERSFRSPPLPPFVHVLRGFDKCRHSHFKLTWRDLSMLRWWVTIVQLYYSSDVVDGANGPHRAGFPHYVTGVVGAETYPHDYISKLSKPLAYILCNFSQSAYTEIDPNCFHLQTQIYVHVYYYRRKDVPPLEDLIV